MFENYWTSALANHLWQSTALVAVAWLLAFALRKNQARTRYWIWLAASIKFLIPFSIFTEAGARIGSLTATHLARPALSHAADRLAQVAQITQPFAPIPAGFTPAVTTARHGNLLAISILAIWVTGSAIAALSWLYRWHQLRGAARSASLLALPAEVPVLSSSSLVEPGIFGIRQPVMLLPEGIVDRLSESQMHAIVAHEITHVRRRDNLTFAMHMLVETIFWFHPLVWWIRARLIEERERACDEAVLQSGNEAETYAEGILNVCKFYVESPSACAAGVTGSDLKKRIVRIMSQALGGNLSLTRKLLLVSIAAALIAVPVVSGLAKAPMASGQDAQSAPLQSFEVATIKPSHTGDDQRNLMMSPGKFTMSGMPLTELIRFAYDLKSDTQLSGGPSWVNSDKFDIEAKETEAQVQEFDKLPGQQRVGQIRLLVQSLLAERFNLKVSHDTKELPIYALVVAKGGSKMTATEAPAPPPPGDAKPGDPPHKKINMSGIRMNGHGELEGLSTTTDLLADVLSRQQELGNRLVLDKTGLTGHYNWKLKWTPAENDAALSAAASSSNTSADDPAAPSLFTALQEQLGLRLDSQKGPVDGIVIDHVDMPTPN